MLSVVPVPVVAPAELCLLLHRTHERAAGRSVTAALDRLIFLPKTYLCESVNRLICAI